ncbi:MAG: hypothetical protein ABW044_08415, partial [Cellvibrio sp.]
MDFSDANMPYSSQQESSLLKSSVLTSSVLNNSVLKNSVQEPSTQRFNPALALTADSLFDLILKFNAFPALYAHPSWVQSLLFLQDTGTTDQELNPYWIRYLSKTLLNIFKLDQQWEFDFSNPAKKIALIDAENLMRLGHCVAAI